MKATVWGCRGSLAAPGPDTVRYGGNTSCVQLELDDGTPVVLDAGTGIRLLGLEYAATQQPIHLCLTHLHLDHLEGLGFFIPIWQAERELHIWGPPSPMESLEERISRLFSPPIFPVPLSDVPANVVCHDLPDEEFQLGSARILAEPVSHRGPTVGYLFQENGCSLAYIPDHEPYLGVEPHEVESDWLSGFTIAKGAAVLFHDAQYTEDEYPSRVTFGHSSVAHAVAFARASDVERLILFHHDPMHSDVELEGLEARARELWGEAGHLPELAREGMVVALETTQARCTPSVTVPR